MRNTALNSKLMSFGISGTDTIGGGMRHRGTQTKQHKRLTGSALNSKLSPIILNE